MSRPEMHIGREGGTLSDNGEWKHMVHGADRNEEAAMLDTIGSTDFNPSPEQSAILREVARGTNSIVVVDAKAGSGKTTTLLQCLHKLPSKVSSVAMIAYNKVNAGLLRARSEKIREQHSLRYLRIESRTFHAYGYSAWLRHIDVNRQRDLIHIAPEKTWQIMQAMLTREEIVTYGQEVVTLVSMAKLHCIAPQHESFPNRTDLLPDTIDEWEKLAEKYRVRPKGDATMAKLIGIARDCLKRSLFWAGALQNTRLSTHRRLMQVIAHLQSDANRIQMLQEQAAREAAEAAHNADGDEEPTPLDGISRKQLQMAMASVERAQFILDYDDLLYLPIVHSAKFDKYDHIFVDEAQDMSQARSIIVERIMKPSTRLYLFGDMRQQIYQFAGSTNQMFSELHHRGMEARPLLPLKDKVSSLDDLLVPLDVPRCALCKLPGHVARDCETGSEEQVHATYGGVVTSHRWQDRDVDAASRALRASQHSVVPEPEPRHLAEPQSIGVYPMSLCRRCPTSIIALAQNIVPEIEAAPNASVGEIHSVEGELELADFRTQPVMVLSRTVVPMLNFAFYLLSQGIRVHVPGRNIGQDLVPLLEFAMRVLNIKETDDTRQLSGKLLAFRKNHTEEQLMKDLPERLSMGGLTAFDDRIDSLLTILKNSKAQLPEAVGAFPGNVQHLYGGNSVRDFKRYLVDAQWVAGDPDMAWSSGADGISGGDHKRPTKRLKRPTVVLSTFHRARGLEMDNVVILNQMDHAKRYGIGREASTSDLSTASQEIEDNLMYIAYTRARKSLSFYAWKPMDDFKYIKSRKRCRITGHTTETRVRPYASSDEEIQAILQVGEEEEEEDDGLSEEAMSAMIEAWKARKPAANQTVLHPLIASPGTSAQAHL
ncbi:hypothetical protein HKX48_002359 [Thoreauomyces humboldtii]|nr:hypothetical protein HKX48_002359 [Thoreauomyces humboldtii]